MKEYKDLLKKEKAHTYMELESYEDMKKLEEIKREQIRLRRSKRNIPRIKNYVESELVKQYTEQGNPELNRN